MLKTDELGDIKVSIKHEENPSTSLVINDILCTLHICENEDKKLPSAGKDKE